MYKKSIEMSDEQAAKISTELLDVFLALYQICPLKLSTSTQNAVTKTIVFKVFPKTTTVEVSFLNPERSYVILSKGKIHKYPKDEYRLDIIYKYIRDNRYFEITLFDEPDDLGYCSILPNYDPSTYVICNIVEKRVDGSKKYEMAFGFDIEKGTFLELFEIVHYNSVGILREYPNLNTPLEAELKGTIILNLV